MTRPALVTVWLGIAAVSVGLWFVGFLLVRELYRAVSHWPL